MKIDFRGYFRASQNFKRKREDNRQPVCPLYYITHISCPLFVRGIFAVLP